MNAEQIDPTKISMTAPARQYVRRQLEREGAGALLLAITESGCNGYMYELRFLGSEPGAGARAFVFDGVRVFVDDAHWTLVRGTEIDYVTEGLNSVLRFRNPNATAECGCGESFSVK